MADWRDRTHEEWAEVLRPRPGRRPIPLDESYVVDAVGCWAWTRHVNRDGYAAVSHGKAHRWVYEQLVGPVPAGYHLDHVCRNTACVNPDHMEPVTPAENNRRRDEDTGRGAYATHCPKGHAYTEANTMMSGAGGRMCRECNRAASREWKRRNQRRRRAEQSLAKAEASGDPGKIERARRQLRNTR